MSSPLVSVIIPTHSRKHWVSEAIESVLAQTYSNHEIIVVDDLSTDDTVEYLRDRFGDKVTVIQNPELSGPGYSRNAGVKISSGEYIAFLDDDDRWLPNHLMEKTEAMLDSDDSVALVGSGCEYIDADGERLDKLKPSYPPESSSYEDFCIKIYLPGSTSNNLIRADRFREIGGFDISLPRVQDKDLWMRLLEHNNIAYTPNITAQVRIHGTPRVNSSIGIIIDCRKRIEQKITDKRLRRKASAWTHFVIFRKLWPVNKPRALWHLLLSFVKHPGRVKPDLTRLKPAMQKMLGR